MAYSLFVNAEKNVPVSSYDGDYTLQMTPKADCFMWKVICFLVLPWCWEENEEGEKRTKVWQRHVIESQHSGLTKFWKSKLPTVRGLAFKLLSYSCHGDCNHYENIFTEYLEYGEANLKNHNAHNSNTLLKITCMELISKWQLKILKSTCTCSSFLTKAEWWAAVDSLSEVVSSFSVFCCFFTLLNPNLL